MTDHPNLAAAPPIPLEKVEWRVDSEPKVDRDGKTRCRFVPYLDGRDIADLLDDWVGPFGWSDKYENGTIDGKFGLWCHLSIYDAEHDRWVTKSDIGVPSNMEAQKGCVSDAFKRAGCAKWGVGRNVYDLPTLRAVCDTYDARNGKTIAVVGKETLPDILRQLRARGFEAEGGKVREADEPADDAPPPDSPEDVDRRNRLAQRLAALPEEAQNRVCAWLQTGGTDPDRVPVSWFDRYAEVLAKEEAKAVSA